ncbi:MAG: diguanylate cyclase domain-containing protein [Bacteroidota bacterium]
MASSSDRGDVLTQARRIVNEDGRLSPRERQDLLNLINELAERTEPIPKLQESAEATWAPAGNSAARALLALLKQQADELDALKKLSLNLTSSLDLQTVLNAVVTEALHLVRNAFTADIFLYSSGTLNFGAAMDSSGPRRKPYMEPRPDGLTFTVARGEEPVIIEDMATHPLYRDLETRKDGSIIGIPLMINNNVVGVMNLSRTIKGRFSPPELRLLGLLADQAAVAISNASLHQMVSRQAYSDTVTGLPNRRALDERLEREVLHARRTGLPFAVMMIDLDDFKQINDTHGHALGDQVLHDLFKHLASGLRSSDFLARYGGDELTLILSQTDLAAARLVTEKLLERVRKYSFPLPRGGELRVSLSGGVALYPIHAMNGTDLLRAADEALYRAKKQSRGSFVVAYGFTGLPGSQ